MALQNHQLVVTDAGGHRVRGEVIEVGHEISGEGELVLTFRTYDWLDFGTYPAVFITPKGTLRGSYEVWSSTLESNEDVILNGHFRRNKRGVALEN